MLELRMGRGMPLMMPMTAATAEIAMTIAMATEEGGDLGVGWRGVVVWPLLAPVVVFSVECSLRPST